MMNNCLIKETPYFEVSEKELNDNIQTFQGALTKYWSNSQLAYSVKTNSLPWVLMFMKGRNVMAEVVSDEEYMLARKCGFNDGQIIFNGPVKSLCLFEESLKKGAFVNIDAQREVDYIAQTTVSIRDTHVGIRINIDTEIFEKGDIEYVEDGFRFGFCEENGELESALKAFGYPEKSLDIGMHLHCNSVTRAVDVYRTLAKYCVKIIKKYNWKPQFIDLGGGFWGGVKEKPDAYVYLSEITRILKETVDENETKLIVEPGAALIASVIDLHTSVLDIKDTAYSRIVTTDGSRIITDPLWKKDKYFYSAITQKKEPIKKQIVCGYTCMDHDRIMILQNQPELSVGDEIIYHRIGAYTVTFGGPFIRYFPDVYINKNNEAIKIRKRMSVDDYFKIQSIE